MKTLVIEGIGDIVSRAVAAAAEKLKIDIPNLRVVFTDDSKHWAGQTRTDRMNTVRRLRQWGADFLDKSDADQLAQYHALLDAEVDAVLIETPDRTHIELAQHWLQGNCKWIYIEKPLTTHHDLDGARRWVDTLKQTPKDHARVLSFDHYRARVHAHFRYAEHMDWLLSIIGELRSFRFYFLEDHSGTDERFKAAQQSRGRTFVDRNGPIENEGRVDALRHGLILDLMPHVLSVLEYFGDPSGIEVSTIQPGIYAGVDYEYRNKAGIDNETFAAVGFSFKDNVDRLVDGAAYVGKGIYGSANYRHMNGNVKVLEVEGESGRKLEFDFHYHTISVIENEQRIPLFDLERDSYYYLLTDIAFRIHKGTRLGLSVEMATIILDKLAEMKSFFDPNSLATYRLGDGAGSTPPLLEDLLPDGRSALPVLKRTP